MFVCLTLFLHRPNTLTLKFLWEFGNQMLLHFTSGGVTFISALMLISSYSPFSGEELTVTLVQIGWWTRQVRTYEKCTRCPWRHHWRYFWKSVWAIRNFITANSYYIKYNFRLYWMSVSHSAGIRRHKWKKSTCSIKDMSNIKNI